MQIGYVELQHASNIAPISTATEEIEFFIIFEGIDHNVLINYQGITGRGLVQLNIRQASECAKDGTSGTRVWGVVAAEL